MDQTLLDKKPAELVEEYIRLRDLKAQAEKTAKEFIGANFVEPMEKLEATILDMLNKTGLDSFSGPSGTAYKHISTSVTVADQREFMRHVIGAEAWELLDVRANKTAVNDLAEKGEPLPPGVNRSAFFTVGIRRK